MNNRKIAILDDGHLLNSHVFFFHDMWKMECRWNLIADKAYNLTQDLEFSLYRIYLMKTVLLVDSFYRFIMDTVEIIDNRNREDKRIRWGRDEFVAKSADSFFSKSDPRYYSRINIFNPQENPLYVLEDIVDLCFHGYLCQSITKDVYDEKFKDIISILGDTENTFDMLNGLIGKYKTYDFLLMKNTIAALHDKLIENDGVEDISPSLLVELFPFERDELGKADQCTCSPSKSWKPFLLRRK